MFKPIRLILFLPQKNNSILRDSRHLSGFGRCSKKRFGGNYRLAFRILQLKAQFICGISGIGRRYDPSGEEDAEDDGSDVNVVGSVDVEDFTTLPVPEIAKTFSELGRGGFYLCVGVFSCGVGG